MILKIVLIGFARVPDKWVFAEFMQERKASLA